MSEAHAGAVRKGIEFLLRTQSDDGSWLSDGQTGRYPVAMTSLAGLALLAAGNTSYSGPHSSSVRNAAEFIVLRADQETGLISVQEPGRPMFGHGYAMLFLAQVYGTEAQTPLRRRIRNVLERAVGLTVRAQAESGGWYYTPDSDQDEGAVTVTQAQGLRACANAGIPVPEHAMDLALGYLRASANPDGGIAYRAGVPGASRPAITCAAVATLYATGIYEGDFVEGALRYALANTQMASPSRAGSTHFLFSHLYLSQVMYFRAGAEWDDYFREVSAWFLAAQDQDGSWRGEYIGRVYGTATALLVLQLPNNNLPILQP
jgi:hypothetical protein